MNQKLDTAIQLITIISHWCFGKDAEVRQEGKKWVIRNDKLNVYQNFSSLERLRNYVCNYTEELIEGNQKWIDQWQPRIDELWELDFSRSKRDRTEKGITETGIINAAQQKGYFIERKGGYVHVTYPSGGQPYKHKGSLLEIAYKVGIISLSEADERLSNDARFV